SEEAGEPQRPEARTHRIARPEQRREDVDAQDVVEGKVALRRERTDRQPCLADRVSEPPIDHGAGGEERDEERRRPVGGPRRASEAEKRDEDSDPQSVGGEHQRAQDDAGAKGFWCERFSTSRKLHHVKRIATRTEPSNSAPRPLLPCERCVTCRRRSLPRHPGRNPIASLASCRACRKKPGCAATTRASCCASASAARTPTERWPERCALWRRGGIGWGKRPRGPCSSRWSRSARLRVISRLTWPRGHVSSIFFRSLPHASAAKSRHSPRPCVTSARRMRTR